MVEDVNYRRNLQVQQTVHCSGLLGVKEGNKRIRAKLGWYIIVLIVLDKWIMAKLPQ